MKITSNTRIMLEPNALQIANSKPAHPKGKTSSVNGKTSNYSKHPVGTQAHWVDMLIQTLSGKPMTKNEFNNKVETFVRSAPNYGIRGGTKAHINASRITSQLIKEGLVIAV